MGNETYPVEVEITMVVAGDHRAPIAAILYNDYGNDYDYVVEVVYLVPEDFVPGGIGESEASEQS